MTVLIADRFERSGIEALEALGLEVLFAAGPQGGGPGRGAGGDEGRRARGAVHEGDRRHPRSRHAVARRAGGRRVRHDRRQGRVPPRHLRVELPGPELGGGGELAFGLILSLDRRIPDNVAELRAGRWNKKEFSKSRGLYGRTLGLLGFGSIGQEMARPRAGVRAEPGRLERDRDQGRPGRRAGRPAGHGVAARGGSPADPTVRVCDSPADVAACCDILSVHLALNEQTRGIVNADVFGRMKPGACFVQHGAREVVDYKALEAAVRTGTCGWPRRVRQGAGHAVRRFRGSADPASGRLRHASHRRVHGPGAGTPSRRRPCTSSGPTSRRAGCRTW